MRIAFGAIGGELEPDREPRDTRFHKRIVRVEKIEKPDMKSAWHQLTLECGHGVTAIGNLAHAAGVVLCTKCRDLEDEDYRAEMSEE